MVGARSNVGNRDVKVLGSDAFESHSDSGFEKCEGFGSVDTAVPQYLFPIHERPSLAWAFCP